MLLLLLILISTCLIRILDLSIDIIGVICGIWSWKLANLITSCSKWLSVWLVLQSKLTLNVDILISSRGLITTACSSNRLLRKCCSSFDIVAAIGIHWLSNLSCDTSVEVCIPYSSWWLHTLVQLIHHSILTCCSRILISILRGWSQLIR